MKAKRPMNMIRRTSSGDHERARRVDCQPYGGDADLDSANQNSVRAAFMIVISQPLAAVTTEFSSVVSTLTCW